MNTLDELDRRRAADAERFASLDEDLCMMCGAVGCDKRSLVMRCFYAIEEVVPEAIGLSAVESERLKGQGYYLRICKDCRGKFLGQLRDWRADCMKKRGSPMDHDGHLESEDEDGNEIGPGTDRNIPVRQDGRIVWMNAEEYSCRAGEIADPAPEKGE